MINQTINENSALMMQHIWARHTAILKENFPARGAFFKQEQQKSWESQVSVKRGGVIQATEAQTVKVSSLEYLQNIFLV